MIRNKNTWQMRNKKEKQNTKHPQVDIVSGRHASQWPIYTFVVWFIGSFAFFFLFLFRHTHTLRNHDDWIRESNVHSVRSSLALPLKSFVVSCFAFAFHLLCLFHLPFLNSVHLACIANALFSLCFRFSSFFSYILRLLICLYFCFSFSFHSHCSLHTRNIRFVCHSDLDTHQINYSNKQPFLRLIIAYTCSACASHNCEPLFFGVPKGKGKWIKKNNVFLVFLLGQQNDVLVVCLGASAGAHSRSPVSFHSISFRLIFVKYALDCARVTCYH